MTSIVQQFDQRATLSTTITEQTKPLDFRQEPNVQEEAFWTALHAAQPYDPETIVPFVLTDEEWDTFWKAVHDE